MLPFFGTLGRYYGDSGIFVRRDVYKREGGVPEIPAMEDIVFVRRTDWPWDGLPTRSDKDLTATVAQAPLEDHRALGLVASVPTTRDPSPSSYLPKSLGK